MEHCCQEEIAMTAIFIRSAAFPHVHLRMDRTQVTGFNANGSGLVNCQYYADAGTEPALTSYEAFLLIAVPAPEQLSGIAFAFQSSVQGEQVFLRMDGGTGTVNCQYYSEAANRRPSKETTKFSRSSRYPAVLFLRSNPRTRTRQMPI
jgi:hypothetical protein